MYKLSAIMYHYVSDSSKSSFPKLKSLELRDFETQLAYIKKNYNIVKVRDVVECFENKEQLPEKACLLTFDDGYKDHFENVLPILCENQIEGSFYIPAKVISGGGLLDVNKVHILLATNNLDDLISFSKKFIVENKDVFNLNDIEFYVDKYAKPFRRDDAKTIFLKRILQVGLPHKVRRKLLDELFEKFSSETEEEISKQFYLNKSDISIMASNGMHIGCHGFGHEWWSSLSKNDLAYEIETALQFLSPIGLDLECWTACYPYGDFSDIAVRLLKEKSCKLAFTTQIDVANLQTTDKFLIPRIDTNDVAIREGARHMPLYFKA